MSFTLVKKLLRDLKSRKGSIFALVLIITIGISVFSGLLSVYRDLEQAKDVYYKEYRLAHFVIELERAPRWAIECCKGFSNVKEIEGRITSPVLVDLPSLGEPLAGVVHSLDEGGQLDGVLLRSGSRFTGRSRNEVVINDQFAREHGLVPGDTLSITLHEKRYNLLIVGTARSPAYVMVIPPGGAIAPDPGRYCVMYCSRRFLENACKLQGASNEVVGTVWQKDEGKINETLTGLSEKLDPYGVTLTTPLQQRVSYQFVADELKGLSISATYLPFCFLVVAAMVLRVLMGRLVAQQRTVIGTLKAIGHSARTIRLHFLLYGLIIGSLGGFCGVAMGYLFQVQMAQLYGTFYTIPNICPHFYLDLALMGFAISLLVSLAGTLSAVRKAVLLEPAEAMRPEPPEEGHHIFLEGLWFFWRRLSFMSKMVARSIFRNPFRASVSVAAASVAMALMFSTICMVDSLHYIINYTFDKVAHQDVTITLRRPRGRGVLTDVSKLAGLSRVQPQLEVPCDLIGPGGKRKRTGVTALPIGSLGSRRAAAVKPLHTPLDGLEGPISIPRRGLILTKKLADIMKAKVGDSVAIRPLIGQRRRKVVPVVSVVDSYLGLGAYCSIPYASRLIGEQWAAQTFLAKEYKGAGGRRYLRQLAKRPAVTAVSSRMRALHQIEETMGAVIGTMLTILVLFAGAIAFGAVLNTALVSLSERQREIGTLRVIGYSPHEVAQLFASESFVLNVVGISIGAALGFLFAHLNAALYNTEMYRFPVIIHPSALVISSSLMIIFVGLAQLVVYWLIAKMAWTEVLKVKE